MAITGLDYWYDGQITRFLEQIVKAFSGFSCMPGIRNGVQQPLQTVPCTLAVKDKQVGYIRNNLSENTIHAVPAITVDFIGFIGARDRLQNPNLVERINVNERGITNGQYNGQLGNTYTVSRIMPKPFEMKIQVDIWTSNQLQKLQLIEQIMTVIYPDFDIQNSENGLDWTSLTRVYVEDDMQLSSVSVPVGTSDEIDIFTITLRVPMWLSPPAKVSNQTLIREIVTQISTEGTEDNCGYTFGQQLAQVATTPEDYSISVDGNTITLLNNKTGSSDSSGDTEAWSTLFQIYNANLNPSVSYLKLMLTPDVEGPYVGGTLTADSDPSKLLWQIDMATLPANTLPTLSGVVDPLEMVPNVNNNNGLLPAPVIGTTYLLFNNGIVPGKSVWGNVSANRNDIIQYTSNGWQVVFNSRSITSIQYVLNSATGVQLQWTGTKWRLAINGTYKSGGWNITF